MTWTEAQAAAVKKKQQADEVGDEIETAPSPQTIWVQRHRLRRLFSRVGRMRQQTFVDICSKAAFANPATAKTPVTAAAAERQGVAVL